MSCYEKVSQIADKWEKRQKDTEDANQKIACEVLALREVAELVGHTEETEIHDFCKTWLQKYEQVTFPKLKAWAGGAESGAKLACQLLGEEPAMHEVKHGDNYGFITLEHRQSGRAFIVSWTSSTVKASMELVDEIKKQIDPRRGAWVQDSHTFTHVTEKRDGKL